MKRDNQNDDGPQENRNRRNDDQVRILIPSRIAGAVIGKGGQHIQKMRSQYKATVSVDDCQGPERTILISSDVESICSIISEMLKYFEEKDDEVDVRLLIHQSLAGCVIGKAGAKIKEIRDKIGCRILKVFSNVAPQSTDRVVQTIGKPDQCVEAVRAVVNLTRETPIKGTIHNYDPINFDDVYAEEYGGFGGQPMGGGGGGGGGGGFRGGDRQSRFDRGGRGGDRFGGGGNDRGGRRRDDRSRSGGRRNDREYINPWANDDNIGGGGGFGGNGMGGGFGGGGFGGGNNSGNFGGGFGGGNFCGGGNMGGGNGIGGGGYNSGGNGPANSYGGSGGGFGSPVSGIGGGGSGSGGNFGGSTGGGFGSGNTGGNGFGSSGNSSSGFGAGNNMGNGLNMGGGQPGGGNLNGANSDAKSTQVTIPKDLAGAIIGKGGGRIRRIRNESGAYITIDEPLPGSNDRIITISGNQKQIQMAQYLLQQSVHENNRRKF